MIFIGRFFLRRVYSLALRLGWPRSPSFFFPLWAASDAIYLGPSGPAAGIHPEFTAWKQVVQDKFVSDAQLHAQLTHRSPWVVGYCFEALMARKSPLLSALPESLGARNEVVCEGVGCMRFPEPLKDYVRHRLEDRP
ncbi:MAG: hypothetical protein ACO1TE_15445 [Prosthecobacter sp.]